MNISWNQKYDARFSIVWRGGRRNRGEIDSFLTKCWQDNGEIVLNVVVFIAHIIEGPNAIRSTYLPKIAK